MDNLLAGILFLCIAVPMPGCSSSAKVFDVPQKLTGVIMTVGNHPFAKLALRTEDSKLYMISGTKQMVGSLMSQQGRVADVFYDRIEKKNGGYDISVVRFEIHSK